MDNFCAILHKYWVFVEVYCGQPFNVANSNRIVTGHYFKDTATYECHTAFRMVGDDTSECQEDHRWSTPPDCQGWFHLMERSLKF